MDLFHKLSKKKILYKTDEERERVFDKLNTLKCHNILNSNFLDHFFFYIYETEEKNIIIRMYKQKYDKKRDDWDREELKLMTSICLNFDDPEDNIYNIDNIDNNDYIEKNNIDLDDIDFFYYYPYDIFEEDIEFFNYQQYNLINVDEEFDKKTLESKWGYEANYKDIRWMINIENMINSNYGIGEKYINRFRSSRFVKTKFQDIYYNNFDKELLIYKKIENTISFVCDLCNVNLENDIWHNNLYGDLCEKCINDKIRKENLKKNLIKKELLWIGKRKLFENELIKTKLYLDKNKIIDLPLLKKNELYKKVFRNTLKVLDKQYYNCSICLENMEHDIYSGNCGHCFHDKCILSIENEECPLCRVYTNFYKIYLD
tara:strand:+ start:103 stop:1221 length:1119 start_codon:yes stop_codon:yes gene_type:complete